MPLAVCSGAVVSSHGPERTATAVKKLLIPLVILLMLIAGRGGQVAALSDCCSVSDYTSGGVFNEGPNIGLGPSLGNAILVGDELLVFFSGGGLTFNMVTPSGTGYSWSLFPGSSNFIPQTGGVIGSFESNFFNPGDTVEEVISFDPATGEPAGQVGAVQTIKPGTDTVTGQVLGQPVGGGGNRLLTPFDQFLKDNLVGPGVNGVGPNGTIEASGAPCDIDHEQDPCVTHISWMTQGLTGKTFVLYRDISNLTALGNWYQFSQPDFYAHTQVPFALVEGHTWEFRLIDMGGAWIADLSVGYGSYGDETPSTDGQTITVQSKPQVTQSQIWVQCTNWGTSWYLFANSTNGGIYHAGWVPAAPNSCAFAFYDITPGIYGGSRLMRYRRVQAHSGGFAPVQAPSSSPPADLAARKGKKPADNNWKPQSVNSPKYTGAVN